MKGSGRCDPPVPLDHARAV